MLDYLQPAPDPADPAIAPAFDELSLWAARFGLLLLQHLELRGNRTILDLGCGTGFPLFELAQVHGRSCQVIGVDLWPAGLARAKAKARVYQLPNAQLVAADGAALPFPAATFDLIVSNLGLNNFAQPAAVLAECSRVAWPGATLALTTNLQGHMHEFYAVVRQVLQDSGPPEALDRLAHNEAHRGTRESVCALLQDAGFRVGTVVEESCQLRFLTGTALFQHFLTRVGFLAGWRAVVDPAAEAALFTTVEQRLNALAAHQGSLTLTVPMLYVEAHKPASE
ncbi:MAG TPA: methyltransferase domain-containing protein [Chloroflexia bacterium]|nr:methyltransferase domain-containing protein [Chloroflexia bacterium]